MNQEELENEMEYVSPDREDWEAYDMAKRRIEKVYSWPESENKRNELLNILKM